MIALFGDSYRGDSMIKYCIKLGDLYYKGMNSKFDKNIKNARFYNTPKMAIEYVYLNSDQSYKDLELIKVNIEEIERIPITCEQFEEHDNCGYKERKRKCANI